MRREIARIPSKIQRQLLKETPETVAAFYRHLRTKKASRALKAARKEK